MADTKISDLTALTGANVASATDVLAIVDTSVTTTKKITRAQLFDISDSGGGQITFPATQNASAGANVLDDYEEGTWTPGISFGGGTTGLTYTSRTGTYTKIGRLVIAHYYLSLNSNGSSSGAALLTGLPFAFPAATADDVSGMGGAVLQWVGMGQSMAYMCVSGVEGATTAGFYGITTANVTLLALTETTFIDSSTVTGLVIYRV